MDKAKRQLFVCGCPRSGTTALGQLIASHPDIIMGIERFIVRNHTGDLYPELFEKERFFDIQPGDTHHAPGDAGYEDLKREYEELRSRYDSAVWVGDKIPALFYRFQQVENRFDRAHIIVILRRNILEVASSYQARVLNGTWAATRDYRCAVLEWNDSNRITLNFLTKPDRKTDITVVDYADLFGAHCDLGRLFGHLGLSRDVPASVRDVYEQMLEESNSIRDKRAQLLTDDNIWHVLTNADFQTADILFQKRLPLTGELKGNAGQT